MNQQLADRIRQCQNLPTLPAIAIQVLDMAQRAEVGIAEIAQVISRDPALSGKILRTVNSSFYARSQQIGTVSHAVTILGLQSVKTLVLGFSLVSNLSVKKGKGFQHLTYWKRSVYAATAARVLCTKLDVIQQEELFVATLLSDIGMLVLDRVLGDEYGELCAAHESHPQLVAAELAGYQMTHAEVGGMLAESWKLPPVLQIPMRHHHDPESASDPTVQRLTELVGAAGRCADVFLDANAAPAIADVRKQLAGHNVPGAECDLLLAEIGRKTREVATLFEINVDSPEDYQIILKRANEALVEMTLRTQQQATVPQRPAAADAPKQAAPTPAAPGAPRAADRQAQAPAPRKPAAAEAPGALPGRPAFDAFLQKAFAAAASGARPLSVVLLEVDAFKALAEKHGAAAGEGLLRPLGRMLAASARDGAMAGRHGDDTMVLALPATARHAAAAAEAVRRAVSARPIDCGNGFSAATTVSIGIAALEPGTPFREAAHLLKAAEMALLAARNAGRNCVRVFALGRAAPPTGTVPTSPAAA